MKQIVFRRVAETELEEAVAWYESRKPGLGAKFAKSVAEEIERIRTRPKLFAVVHRDIRQATMAVYPYCIYYRIRDSRVVVLAVFHASRNPAIWQGRS